MSLLPSPPETKRQNAVVTRFLQANAETEAQYLKTTNNCVLLKPRHTRYHMQSYLTLHIRGSWRCVLKLAINVRFHLLDWRELYPSTQTVLNESNFIHPLRL
jgi:hypothetical protein